MSEVPYIGKELELFSHAKQWKAYYGEQLQSFLHGKRVIEVGAGLGETTPFLLPQGHHFDDWLLCEPDSSMAALLGEKIDRGELPSFCSVFEGTTAELETKHGLFDAALYIDVLEHIEADVSEMKRIARFLRPGGVVIVLSPAHNWLFSPFDKAIGHFRRYTTSSLARVFPESLAKKRLCYLDSFGMFASCANKLLLQQSMPTIKQVKFWDNYLVPVSKRLDPLLRFAFGKSVLGIYEKQG